MVVQERFSPDKISLFFVKPAIDTLHACMCVLGRLCDVLYVCDFDGIVRGMFGRARAVTRVWVLC